MPPRVIPAATFLIESLTIPGGSERQCIELARQMSASGTRLSILTLEGGLGVHSAAPVDADIELRAIGRSKIGSGLRRLHPKLGQFWEMLRLGRAARRRGAPLLVPHHFPAHWAAVFAASGTGRRVVWMCNDWLYQPIRGASPKTLVRRIVRRVALAFDRAMAHRVDRVLVLSRYVGRDVDAGYQVSSVVYRTGASGTRCSSPEERALARRRLGIRDDEFLVSTLCILMPHRRVHDVLRAIRELPSELRARTRFVHVGGGDDAISRSLMDLGRELGLEANFSLLGRTSEEMRVTVLAASDVFVFPVEGQSWGLAPFEALAAGVPVILSRASGAAEVLRHQREALLYDVGDIPALARCLMAVSSDESLRARLVRDGFRRWENRFGWARAARRFGRLLDTASDGRR